MKYIRLMILVVFFHLVMNLFMPWWNIFIAGIIAGYFSKLNAFRTFFVVGIAIIVYWLILIFKIDNINNHILSERIGALVEVDSFIILALINATIGGLCAAVASQIGHTLKKIIRKTKGL